MAPSVDNEPAQTSERDTHSVGPVAPRADVIEAPLEAGDLVEIDAGPSGASGSRRRPDPIYNWVLLVMCCVVLVLSATLTIREGRQVLVPLLGEPLPELCHMKRYTGVECPGCGLTRSFISIAHGRLWDAWRYNPGGFLLFPIMLFQIPYRMAQVWRGRRGLSELQLGRWGQAAIAVVGVVLVTQWLARLLAEIG